jgi:hypothetical protein
MDDDMVRIVVSVLTGFIALTAIGGGGALLVGVEQQRFPLDWLRGTPFKDYTIPAILLAVVVGGSALPGPYPDVTTTLHRYPLSDILLE